MALIKLVSFGILMLTGSNGIYIGPGENPHSSVHDPALIDLNPKVDPLPPPNVVNFIGVGYNILEGNPEGADITNGGVDPGLLTNRRILALTYDENNLSDDLKYMLPDEVKFSPRSSCMNTSLVDIFHGTSSYQEKLTKEIGFSVGAGSMFAGFEFSFSNRYEKVQTDIEHGSYIYREERNVCNKGQARYTDELAGNIGYFLNDGFVADSCRLSDIYDETSYMHFLEAWGTHFVVEADVGIKGVLRYEEEEHTFVHYASTEKSNTVSPKVQVKGYSLGVEVEMSKFKSEFNSNTKFGYWKETYNSGSADFHEPLMIELMSMHEVFEEKYWQQFDDYVNRDLCIDPAWKNDSLPAIADNIYTALTNYTEWKNAQLSSDPPVEIPVTWPKGNYGLPELAGPYYCPDNIDVTWERGYRKHDTNTNNHWSNPYHLEGETKQEYMIHHFCMKTYDPSNDYGWEWPTNGQYCIYAGHLDATCPTGFQSGYVRWDDKNNVNSKWGTKPYGVYDYDKTKIYFCCATSGNVMSPIYLPTDEDFILFKYSETDFCQQVYGMEYEVEYFHWDTVNTFNDDKEYGAFPRYGVYGSKGENIRLEFCHYRVSNSTQI